VLVQHFIRGVLRASVSLRVRRGGGGVRWGGGEAGGELGKWGDGFSSYTVHDVAPSLRCLPAASGLRVDEKPSSARAPAQAAEPEQVTSRRAHP
jgi:hypothetical protein